MKKAHFIIMIVALLVSEMILAQPISSIWLSGEPTSSLKGKVRPGGMQHYFTIKDRGKMKFLLWPRYGAKFQNAEYLNAEWSQESTLLHIGPNGKELAIDTKTNDLGHHLEYAFKEEGWHSIYLILKEQIGDSTFVHIAKQERMSHQCRNGHDKVMSRMEPKLYPEIVPLELIRLRQPHENFHGILETGIPLRFQLYFQGKPVADQPVKVTTQMGWVLELKTDADGFVEFQMPSDYFPGKAEFNRKKTNRFLIETELAILEEGQSTFYSTKMEFEYIPSKSLYQSSILGWILLSFGIIALSLIVFLVNRVKRKKHKYIY